MNEAIIGRYYDDLPSGWHLIQRGKGKGAEYYAHHDVFEDHVKTPNACTTIKKTAEGAINEAWRLNRKLAASLPRHRVTLLIEGVGHLEQELEVFGPGDLARAFLTHLPEWDKGQVDSWAATTWWDLQSEHITHKRQFVDCLGMAVITVTRQDAPSTPTPTAQPTMPKDTKPKTALAKRAAAAKPDTIQVWDRKKERFVDVPADQASLFQRRLESILRNAVDICLDLADIADRELYRAGGFSSFKEFALTSNIPISYRQSLKYVTVGRRLVEIYGDVETARSEVASPGDQRKQLKKGDSSPGTAFQTLGIERWYDLRELGDADLRHIIEEGTIRIGDQELPVEEFLDMKARTEGLAVADLVEELRSKQARVQQLEEQLKLKDEEAGANHDTVEKARADLEAAQRIEARFGPEAQRFADKTALLDDVRKSLNAAAKGLTQANIRPDDDPLLQEDFRGLLVKFAEVIRGAVQSYDEVLIGDPQAARYLLNFSGLLGTPPAPTYGFDDQAAAEGSPDDMLQALLSRGWELVPVDGRDGFFRLQHAASGKNTFMNDDIPTLVEMAHDLEAEFVEDADYEEVGGES